MVFLDRAQVLETARYLPPLHPFRESFEYNNWGYEIAAQLLESTSGRDLPDMMKESIFTPLGMGRTSLAWNLSDPNEAKSYGILSDRSSVEIERPFPDNENMMMKAAGGIKSSLSDLVAYYKVFMKDTLRQFEDGTDMTPQSPLRHCRMISSHNAQFPGFSLREQGYGLGWARAQLPGQLGRISANIGFIEEPIVNKGGISRLVLYHHGLMPGSTSAVLLVPELEAGVVVLQNSMPAIDTADFIAQMLLEALLEVPEPNDYVALSKMAYQKAISHVEGVRKELDERQSCCTTHRPYSEYEGQYWNEPGSFFIEIRHKTDHYGAQSLQMVMNGINTQEYNLDHYHNDTFSWLMTYDDMTRRARVPFYGAQYFLIEFETDESGINYLRWAADGNFAHSRLKFHKVNLPTTHDLDEKSSWISPILWIILGLWLTWKVPCGRKILKGILARLWPTDNYTIHNFQTLPRGPPGGIDGIESEIFLDGPGSIAKPFTVSRGALRK